MKVELSNNLIDILRISLLEKYGYWSKHYKEFSEAIMAEESKEINYENFGNKTPRQKKIMDAILHHCKCSKKQNEEIDLSLDYPKPDKNGNFKIYRNTNLNHLDLKRDEKGRFLLKYRTIAFFVYPHTPNGKSKSTIDRNIIVEKENKDYIEGYDENDENKYKRFRKDRIIGDIYKQKVVID